MLLKSLRLHNFRQYKGTQIVLFSTDPEKNVTVILGNNTYGKTTLLQAFNWCFYGKARLENPEDLLNIDIAEQMSYGDVEDVEVEIELIHKGKTYTLTRSRSYRKSGSDVVGDTPKVSMSYRRDDGQTEPVKANRIDGVIKSIIPEDLLDYFFFDTERVASVSSRKDLGNAVRDLLGLTPFEKAAEHLGSKNRSRSVIGKLYAALDEDGSFRAKDALTRIQSAQERLDEIKIRLTECEEEKARLDAKRQQYDETLNQHATSKGLQERKIKLERAIANDKRLLAETTKALRKDFCNESLRFFVAPLLDRAEQMLKDADLDDKGITDLTRLTLEEILNRGVCVCGLKFDEHPEAIEHINKEMRYCPPESIGTAVRNYIGELRRFAVNQDHVLDGIRNRQANMLMVASNIQENNDEVDEISLKLQDLPPNLSVIEKARNDVKSQLRAVEEKRESLLRDQGTQKSMIDRYQKVYDQYSSASGKNRQTMLYIKYAEAVKEWVDKTYSDREGSIRETLQDRVNSIFSQMYHGRRKVVIDSKYNVVLLTEMGSSAARNTGESEGLNRVKSFAFIAGLVSMAKDKAAGVHDDDTELASEPYPLVMDAPFSNTDETHIANISRVLPAAAEQVIMFVMLKDWRYAEPVLSNRIGARYELNKYSEKHSELKGA